MMIPAPEEIMVLAEHQKEILERRFPNYGCHIHSYGSQEFGSRDVQPNCLMVVSNDDHFIFIHMSFCSSYVEITQPYDTEETFVLDYADPKFTDDTISDMLKAWEKWNMTHESKCCHGGP